mgnify:CR=1 FL=1|tara:strand:- start:398 stop:1252 length:855 start_codon:yes stop_codon:yes gene_type:complete
MIIRDTDYANDTQLTAAIDAYLSNASADRNTSVVYLNKVKFDLDRSCEQEEFFLNVLHHQTTNGFQDTGETVEIPVFIISLDGSPTLGVIETLSSLVYAAGDVITLAAVDGTQGLHGSAVYPNGTVLVVRFYDNAAFTGTQLFSITPTLTNNAVTQNFTIPAGVSGRIYGQASIITDAANSVEIDTGGDALVQTVYGLTDTQIVAYYNLDDLSQAVPLTFSLQSGVNASDYAVTASVRSKSNIAISQVLYDAVTPAPTNFSFTPNNISNSLTGSVEISISIDPT